MRYALSALLVFALALPVNESPSTLVAQAPAPVVQPAPGPTLVLPAEVKGDVGAFIKVAAVTTGKEVRWYAVTPGLAVFPAELLRNSQITVVTATQPGAYKLLAYTAVGDVPSDPVTTVIVVGGVPIPPPVPGPDQPPQLPNTLPDGRYKFAKAVYDEAVKIPFPARSRAVSVSDNYAGSSQSLAAQIAAGATPTTAEIQAAIAALKEKNRASLGTDITAWSAWGAALTAKFNGHNADGTLRSGADYVDAFSEISIGLKAITPPLPPAPTKPTAITYVFEKDQGGVPAAVLAGLNRLNREKQILATVFEEDSVDGAGEVPEQYRLPLKAAQEAGLPALVATNGDKVMRVLKAPKSEAEVLELAP